MSLSSTIVREAPIDGRAFVGHVSRLEDAAVAEIMARLEDARTSVAGRLASTDWDRYMLPKMEGQIEAAMGKFASEYEDALGDASLKAWGFGADELPGEVEKLVKGVTFPRLDTNVLTMAQDLNHQLITDLSDEMNEKILSEVKRGLLGDRPLGAVMKRIGRNLDDPSVFGSIATRAEVIARTETSRVYNLANHERDQQFAGTAPDLGLIVTKVWISSRTSRTRSAHWAAHGQEVPLDKPFIVGGERIRFPLDPGASAKNTVNCRCTYRRSFKKRSA